MTLIETWLVFEGHPVWSKDGSNGIHCAYTSRVKNPHMSWGLLSTLVRPLPIPSRFDLSVMIVLAIMFCITHVTADSNGTYFAKLCMIVLIECLVGRWVICDKRVSYY